MLPIELSYDLPRVTASVAVAVLACWTAIDLAGRGSASLGLARWISLLGSSAAVGGGAWCMFFITRLTVRPQAAVGYGAAEWLLWLLAVGIAVAGSRIAPHAVDQEEVTLPGMLRAAPTLSSGIGALHYASMARLRMVAAAVRSACLIASSVVVALVGRHATLLLLDRIRGITRSPAVAVRGVAAIALAIVASGLDAEIAAASIAAASAAAPEDGRALVTSSGLSIAVIAGTLLILAVVLLRGRIDRWARRSLSQWSRMRHDVLTRRMDARFRALVQCSSDVIFILERDSTIRYASPAVERVFGYRPGDLADRRLFDLVHEEDLPTAFDYLIANHSSAEEATPTVWRIRHSDGEWLHVESSGANLEAGADQGAIVLNSRDISDRVSLEAKLVHQAFHDALTGLANRSLFRDRVEHAIAGRARHGKGIAVLFLDLDEFKTVNDSLGHATGDRLLSSVAARLLNATRGSDTVARLGGDEFAVLLDNVRALDEVLVVVERILGTFRGPFHLDGREVRIGTSIGIARVADGEGAEEVLRNADVAMYRAKREGKGCYRLFAPEMHTELLDRLELEADLRYAVERIDTPDCEFRLVYQPIVELDTERVIGVEALVRWEHPARGTVAPNRFIPIAEETGLILPLGRWILDEACREVASWDLPENGKVGAAEHPASLGSGPAVTVNLSGYQLQDPDLVPQVARALVKAGLDPHRLVLEITESVIMQDTEPVLVSLRALRELGVRLAIDDFGTGYSSLSYLQKFPIDILKIDKTFIDGIARGGQGAALTRTIIALGDMLALRMVAEGVEQSEQCLHLRALGCGYAQGYLFAQPLPPEAAAELLRKPSAVAPATSERLTIGPAFQ